MINTVIWGTEKISALIKQIIEKIYNKEALSQKGDALNVVGFVKEKIDTAEVHETISEDDIFSLNQIAEKYNHRQIDIIIVPIDLYMGANDIVFSMINCNISLNDIYLFERSALYSSNYIDEMIEPLLFLNTTRCLSVSTELLFGINITSTSISSVMFCSLE